MSWEEYYREVSPISFREHEGGYCAALAYLTAQSSALNCRNRLKNIILGGFCPHNKTVESFVRFSKSQFTDENVKLFVLDMNRQPLETFDKRATVGVMPLQANLTNLPLKAGSIDLLFLDYTFEFMSLEQIKKAAGNLSYQLTKNGLLLVINHMPFLRTLDNISGSNKHRVKNHCHRPKDIEAAVSPSLKRCYEADCRDRFRYSYSIQAFSRHDAPYKTFTGEPFAKDF